MKGTIKRISSLEARLKLDSANQWAYFEEAAFLTMSEADQTTISNILQKMDQAYAGSIQDALSVLTDAELDELEAFLLKCSWPDEDDGP